MFSSMSNNYGSFGYMRGHQDNNLRVDGAGTSAGGKIDEGVETPCLSVLYGVACTRSSSPLGSSSESPVAAQSPIDRPPVPATPPYIPVRTYNTPPTMVPGAPLKPFSHTLKTQKGKKQNSIHGIEYEVAEGEFIHIPFSIFGSQSESNSTISIPLDEDYSGGGSEDGDKLMGIYATGSGQWV